MDPARHRHPRRRRPPPTPAPPPAAPDPVDTAALYAELAERGLDYGPSFQGLRAARRDGTTVHASVEVPGPAEGFGPHPAVLDSTLHALHPSGLLPDHDGAPLVPYSWRGVRAHHPGTTAARATITRLDDSSVSLLLTDGTDRPLLTVDRLTLRPATPPPAATSGGHLHATDWVEVAPTSTAPAAATEWAPSGDAAEELPTLLDLLDRPDRVVVRTRGAVDLGDEPVVPEAAGLWGWCAPPRPNTPAGWSSSTPTTAPRRCASPWPPGNRRWRSATAGCSPRASPRSPRTPPAGGPRRPTARCW
ncbi:polyketide synthase dehydratase domain-containing protein [Actinoalloteichus caeruleus]|uniref:polyketide synthase dehydratase domain-containing protein n=1 Tax=Actinoalloteichus cyanogriseus TaxID=2893586 RepID=UPI003558DC6F